MLSTSAAGPAAVRGGAMRVGGYIVGAFVSVLSAALLFRHLGRAETGPYVAALSLVAIVAIAWIAYWPTLAAGVALACVGLLLQATQDNFALPLVVGLRLGTIAVLDLSRQVLTTALTIALVLAGATLVPFLGMTIPVGAVLLVATTLSIYKPQGIRQLRHVA